MATKLWTARELMDLRSLHAEGMRAPEMARELGRSTASVRHKCQELNLKLKLGGSEEEKNMPDPTEASRQLGEAINALIFKMRPSDLRNLRIGPSLRIVEPGTERVYYGQGAERALAA